MKKFAKMALAAAIAGFGLVAQAGIVIDNFSVAQGTNVDEVLLFDATVANASGFYQSVNGSTSDIVGGQRDLYVEKTSGGSGRVEASVENGLYRYSTPTGAAGTGFLKWDGQNEANVNTIQSGTQASFLSTLDAIGLGGLNLNAGGNAFLINVIESDIGFDFAMTVFTDATHWTTLVLAAAAHHLGVPGPDPIHFADFEGATDAVGSVIGSGAFRVTGSGGAANLSNVGALLAQVNFSGDIGTVDLSIADVTTVPEPESLALVGLGLLGLAATRRRKIAA